MCNDAVPIDLEGSLLLPIIPERKIVTDYFKYKGVTNAKLETDLFNLLQDFLESLQAKDQAKMSQLGEATFVEKLNSKKDASGAWFNFERAQYSVEKVLCVDKLLVKGLGVDRSTNEDQMDYQKVNNLEPQGMRQFVHKWDLGFQDYYYIKRFEKELKLI